MKWFKLDWLNFRKIETKEEQKPYKNYYYSGRSITIVLNDNSVIVREVTPDKVEEIRNSKSLEELFTILDKGYINYDKLANVEGFYKQGESYYLYPSVIPLPEIIKTEFLRVVEQNLPDELQALKMFWYNVSLNPNPESRKDTFDYIKAFDVKLTSNGQLVLFRNIVSVKKKTNSYIQFITHLYFKIKSWKKSPKNYFIYENEGKFKFRLFNDGTSIGTLHDLYEGLKENEDNLYTDDYSKTYKIRIGDVYKINPEDLDKNRHKSCGGALHVTTHNSYNYSDFGDTSVCVIVNPRFIWKNDTGYSGKLGVTEMFVAGITKNVDGVFIDINDKDLVNFDEYYYNLSLEQLQQSLLDNNVSIPEDLTKTDVKRISNQLINRVVKF